MSNRRAVVYFFWGEPHMREAIRSATATRAVTRLPVVAITDAATRERLSDDTVFADVIVTARPLDNLLAKAALYESLPPTYDSFLFLDTDATVIDDVAYGFAKADEFGIAAAMAPHYGLDHFLGFDRVLAEAGVPRASQLQYNTGAIFFTRRDDVAAVFEKWRDLAFEYGPRCEYYIDQPFFTLAMELLRFNPFTLSPSYNYRALGELASGHVRIWHSHALAPAGLNEFDESWPLRRFFGDQRMPF